MSILFGIVLHIHEVLHAKQKSQGPQTQEKKLKINLVYKEMYVIFVFQIKTHDKTKDKKRND